MITFGAAFGSQKLFPDMTYIDTEEVINSTVKFFTDIGEYFSLVFSGNTSGLFSGYFSSDNFFINNNIELNAPPQSANDPVLKVTSSGENGMYLVGDIGVDFDGRSWIGVQRKISQNELYSGEYNISDSFSPEQIVQMTRYLNMSGLLLEKKLSDYEYRYIDAHYEMSDYDDMRAAISTMEGISGGEPVFLYSSQNVNIEYLKNTNVVFKPFLPDNNSYMSNENFKYFGDTVIRIADRKNWMKSFESNVTLPVNPALFAVTLDSSDDNEKISLLQTVGYTYEEARRYIDDKKEYDRYVYDTYSSVPKSEKDNIKRFIAEFESKDGDNAGIVDNKMLYAYGMCEYLRTHYQYSLNADNTSDRSNTMLGNFLFNTKQGHCALYASTMVLALREKEYLHAISQDLQQVSLTSTNMPVCTKRPFMKIRSTHGLRYTAMISAGYRLIRPGMAVTVISETAQIHHRRKPRSLLFRKLPQLQQYRRPQLYLPIPNRLLLR